MIKKIVKGIYKITLSPEMYAQKLGVKVGNGCSIDSSTKYGAEPYLIKIGDYVRIANDTSFYTHGGVIPMRHYYNDPSLDHFGKISIGNYTSIGAHCMIMPGVKIGDRCIVGGGSVVTKSIPDGCMVAGNPAKYIGKTEDFYKRLKEKYDTGTGGMQADEKKHLLLSLPEEKFETKKLITIPENRQ